MEIIIDQTFLNADILLHLKTFVDITLLLSTTTKFKDVKKNTNYFKFDGKLSLKYIEDVVFREEINKLIVNPNRQLNLNLRAIYRKNTSLFNLQQINVLDKSMFGILANIHTLNLSDCNYIKDKDIYLLRNTFSLKLCSCKGFIDVSSLYNVHSLDLSNTDITDISALENVHTLFLKECKKLTDVSTLGRVNTLNLSRTSGITDVSHLGNVHNLNLSKCIGITEVNELGNVKILNVTGCINIANIDKFILSRLKNSKKFLTIFYDFELIDYYSY
jgi:hypothetical protein